MTSITPADKAYAALLAACSRTDAAYDALMLANTDEEWDAAHDAYQAVLASEMEVRTAFAATV